MKTETRTKVHPERLSFDNDNGEVTLFRSPEDTDRAFLIATGFGAVPELYFGLAEELALSGYNVLIPDINSPLEGEDPDQTIAYKARRIARCTEALASHTKTNNLELAGHSFGGVVIMEALPFLTQPPSRLHLISSVGFGGVINETGVIDVRQVPGFYLSEVIGATRHLNKYLGLSALKTELTVMANVSQRRREIREMHTIPNGYMVTKIGSVGVDVRVYVAPKDHVVDPQPTLDVHANVIKIHPRATHFSPATHGPHVAHLLVA